MNVVDPLLCPGCVLERLEQILFRDHIYHDMQSACQINHTLKQEETVPQGFASSFISSSFRSHTPQRMGV